MSIMTQEQKASYDANILAGKYTDKSGVNPDTIIENGLYVIDDGFLRVATSNFDNTIVQELNTSARTSPDGGATWTAWVDKSAELDVRVSDLEAYTAQSFELATQPTGFDLRDHDYHGILELCPLASGGMYWRIDENNVYSKITSATTFGDGVTPLADGTLCHRPTAVHGEIKFWNNGTKHIKTESVLIQLQNISDKQIVVYKNDGSIGFATTVSDAISVDTIICIVTGNPTSGQKVVFANERHGLDMSGATHEMLHETLGARWGDGLEVVGISDNGNTFQSLAVGTIWDEDLKHTVEAVATAPFIYRDVLGDWAIESDGAWSELDGKFTQASSPVVRTTNTLRLNVDALADCVYNKEEVNGDWSLVDTGADYVIMHFFATNDAEFPVFKVVGQNLYPDRTTARQRLDGEISTFKEGELPSPEFLHLFSYILDGVGNIETGIDAEVYVDFRHGYPIARYS